MTVITSLATAPPRVDYGCFEGVTTSTCVLRVPKESINDYKSAVGWNEFYNICAIEDSQIGKASIKVSGSFYTFAGHMSAQPDQSTEQLKKVWVYGEDPQKEPAFTPGAWDAAQMRFSDDEGRHFPYLSDYVYCGGKTLTFKITDVSDDAALRVFNGWWSATYIDGIQLKKEIKNDLWELTLTEDMAQDCARGNGGAGKDLDLMLTFGTATFHSVYYEDVEIFSVSGDIEETFEFDIVGKKIVHLVGQAENNAINVTLDGQPVPSEREAMFEAMVILKPGAVLQISNK